LIDPGLQHLSFDVQATTHHGIWCHCRGDLCGFFKRLPLLTGQRNALQRQDLQPADVLVITGVLNTKDSTVVIVKDYRIGDSDGPRVGGTGTATGVEYGVRP